MFAAIIHEKNERAAPMTRNNPARQNRAGKGAPSGESAEEGPAPVFKMIKPISPAVVGRAPRRVLNALERPGYTESNADNAGKPHPLSRALSLYLHLYLHPLGAVLPH